MFVYSKVNCQASVINNRLALSESFKPKSKGNQHHDIQAYTTMQNKFEKYHYVTVPSWMQDQPYTGLQDMHTTCENNFWNRLLVGHIGSWCQLLPKWRKTREQI